MAAVAVVAGAPVVPDALRLGASMTAIQFAIGALNDVHDAPTDAGRTPPKPIPAGLVPVGLARLVVVLAAAVGLGLAATFGAGILALAAIGLAVGVTYDLAARGTAWSWLPFAVGIPILPVYGWYGATGALPDWAMALVPAAACAGGAIAVANARADHERDRATGVSTIATRLGEGGSRAALVAAWGSAAAIAIGWLVAGGAGPVAVLPVAGALAVIGAGVALGWQGSPQRLEWAWRIQAIGAGLTAVAWLGAVVALG